MKLFFALAFLLCMPRAPLFAWSGPGHMVIAAEAYRQLSPELQRSVTEILKAHPAYAKWESSFAKYGDGIDLPTFFFMHAATWPDEIRRGGGELSKYDHPKWHYIDWPLRPPSFPMDAEPAPTDDVVYGIAQSEKFLADTNSSPEVRAVYLSYLIHLVGDVHQPLHCASLFTTEFPKGDKGGNDLWIRPAGASIKLHSFWDQLLGSRVHERTEYDDALRIVAEHPRKSLPELANATPRAWSLEGRQLAIDKAYLDGKLKLGTSAENATPLPDGYTKEAKAVAEKQAALAGYRLADEIGRFVK